MLMLQLALVAPIFGYPIFSIYPTQNQCLSNTFTYNDLILDYREDATCVGNVNGFNATLAGIGVTTASTSNPLGSSSNLIKGISKCANSTFAIWFETSSPALSLVTLSSHPNRVDFSLNVTSTVFHVTVQDITYSCAKLPFLDTSRNDRYLVGDTTVTSLALHTPTLVIVTVTSRYLQFYYGIQGQSLTTTVASYQECSVTGFPSVFPFSASDTLSFSGGITLHSFNVWNRTLSDDEVVGEYIKGPSYELTYPSSRIDYLIVPRNGSVDFSTTFWINVMDGIGNDISEIILYNFTGTLDFEHSLPMTITPSMNLVVSAPSSISLLSSDGSCNSSLASSYVDFAPVTCAGPSPTKGRIYFCVQDREFPPYDLNPVVEAQLGSLQPIRLIINDENDFVTPLSPFRSSFNVSRVDVLSRIVFAPIDPVYGELYVYENGCTTKPIEGCVYYGPNTDGRFTFCYQNNYDNTSDSFYIRYVDITSEESLDWIFIQVQQLSPITAVSFEVDALESIYTSPFTFMTLSTWAPVSVDYVSITQLPLNGTLYLSNGSYAQTRTNYTYNTTFMYKSHLYYYNRINSTIYVNPDGSLIIPGCPLGCPDTIQFIAIGGTRTSYDVGTVSVWVESQFSPITALDAVMPSELNLTGGDSGTPMSIYLYDPDHDQYNIGVIVYALNEVVNIAMTNRSLRINPNIQFGTDCTSITTAGCTSLSMVGPPSLINQALSYLTIYPSKTLPGDLIFVAYKSQGITLDTLQASHDNGQVPDVVGVTVLVGYTAFSIDIAEILGDVAAILLYGIKWAFFGMLVLTLVMFFCCLSQFQKCCCGGILPLVCCCRCRICRLCRAKHVRTEEEEVRAELLGIKAQLQYEERMKHNNGWCYWRKCRRFIYHRIAPKQG